MKQFPMTCQRKRDNLQLGERRRDIFHKFIICFLQKQGTYADKHNTRAES